MSDLPHKSQFLIYQTENGAIKIDVRFEEDTVWLTQPLMAKLFQATQQNISLHPEATHKESLARGLTSSAGRSGTTSCVPSRAMPAPGSRCARWRRSAPTSWPSRRKPRGCWMDC